MRRTIQLSTALSDVGVEKCSLTKYELGFIVFTSNKAAAI